LEEKYKFYYWRTKQGSEIDVVLEKENRLIGVEIKYKRKAMNRAFENRYPQAEVKMLTADNFY
jgi:predicted AAA+ superfamily ATPase